MLPKREKPVEKRPATDGAPADDDDEPDDW
jgi:hypothetical protein